MKKVLIITYYWPPSGGGGVQRWLKFIKYLREFGWEPVVYTPSSPDFEIIDHSLEKDVPTGLSVIKRPIWEPYSVYRSLLGKKAVQKQGVIGTSSKSLLTRLSIWIRGNYFIPDARIFWVRPSVNFLTKHIDKNDYKAIISTGPPHSMHLIALELKKRTGIKWLADFRDPWSKWDVLDQLNLNTRSWQSHKKLEQDVLTNADRVITVSPTLKKSLQELGAKSVEVITNGYDFSIDISSDTKPDKFRIFHGGLLNRGRNPLMLWEVLTEICQNSSGFASDLEIYLSGTIEHEVIESIKAYPLLADKLVNMGYLNHKELNAAYQQAALLLLLVNNTNNGQWILPGKMFEYLAQGKPILTLGMMDSDANNLLVEAGYQAVITFNDREKIMAAILNAYEKYSAGSASEFKGKIEKYHRRELTKSLAYCLDQL